MKTKNRIRDWKGLLHEEPRRIKIRVFASLLIISVSMTFTQFGFIGIGANGEFLCYALGLLAPVAATSLLLGKGLGALHGLLSGTVLYVHALWQPLDLFERFFVSVLNSLVLYAFIGFLLGFLFAIALRNNPSGKRRTIRFAIISFFVSIIASLLFLANGIVHIITLMLPTITTGQQQPYSSRWFSVVSATNGTGWQILVDILLLFAVSVLTNHIVQRRRYEEDHLSVRSSFRTRLFVAMALIFCMAQAVCFVAITQRAVHGTFDSMGDELDYLSDQLNTKLQHNEDLQQVMQTYDLPEESRATLMETSQVENVLDGYDFTDGTILIIKDDKVVASYNPAYPVGMTLRDLFVSTENSTLDELSQRTTLRLMVYDTQRRDIYDDDSFTTAQLGYMRARNVDNVYYIMKIDPASMVFANRRSTMIWATVLALVLLVTAYVLAARFMGKDVVAPIDRTNASLLKITSGDLDEIVREVDTVEFTSLSAGINTTVGTLKHWIAEAERRNERELATAKAIQESALPRVFPPFPEVSAFDIFAAMDAAKQVGGDFYDFFLIDDHTLGFLIADVSGKGIPGALFMMAAKTEIENYLSTGMEPAQAITSANKRLCANNDAGMFVTVWAATLDWKTGLLTYVNAGHNFPLLRHGNGGSWEWLKKKCGLFLGTFETAKYRQETLTLEPGDEILLYTDGVNEAFNEKEQEYGNDQLEAFVAAHAHMHPRELVRTLRADVARWAGNAEQSDDVTILALEYGVASEVTGSITVPATIDHLAEVKALVNEELMRRLCPVDVLHRVLVALEELFVNVCQYAYADQLAPGNAQVSYAYGTDPSSITVELRDTGIPFNPLTVEEPKEPESIHEAPMGGLGIHLVRQTMDDFVYIRDDDTNIVVFKKGW